MKIKIITLALLLPILGISQKKIKELKQYKIAYITQKLSLTVKEAEKFWPIYNAFEDELHSTRESKSKYLLNSKSVSEMSDKEAEEKLKEIQKNEAQVYELHARLISDLLKFLPPKKIIKLKIAEKQFRHRMIKRIKKKQMN